MTVVVIGSGDKVYDEMFLRLSRQFPNKIAVKVAYDNALAHKIEAGSDMFLMPSRYEPCGLNQIYSLKYGTVPIVRATGGLDDTIEPWDARTGKGTGFKFTEYNGEALLLTIPRSLARISATRLRGRRSMKNGMSRRFLLERFGERVCSCVRAGSRTAAPKRASERSKHRTWSQPPRLSVSAAKRPSLIWPRQMSPRVHMQKQ